jgi:hypothetical protein
MQAILSRVIPSLCTGWFKEVNVKDIDSHSVRALLAVTSQIQKPFDLRVFGQRGAFSLPAADYASVVQAGAVLHPGARLHATPRLQREMCQM